MNNFLVFSEVSFLFTDRQVHGVVVSFCSLASSVHSLSSVMHWVCMHTRRSPKCRVESLRWRGDDWKTSLPVLVLALVMSCRPYSPHPRPSLGLTGWAQEGRGTAKVIEPKPNDQRIPSVHRLHVTWIKCHETARAMWYNWLEARSSESDFS